MAPRRANIPTSNVQRPILREAAQLFLKSSRLWKSSPTISKEAGFSVGWLSAVDLEGRTIWIVDAHGYGKRFIVRADEKLTAFLEPASGPSGGTPRGDFW
jgi:hypothetical protein